MNLPGIHYKYVRIQRCHTKLAGGHTISTLWLIVTSTADGREEGSNTWVSIQPPVHGTKIVTKKYPPQNNSRIGTKNAFVFMFGLNEWPNFNLILARTFTIPVFSVCPSHQNQNERCESITSRWPVIRACVIFVPNSTSCHAKSPHLALFLIPKLVATEPSPDTHATTPTVQPPVGTPSPVTATPVSILVLIPVIPRPGYPFSAAADTTPEAPMASAGTGAAAALSPSPRRPQGQLPPSPFEPHLDPVRYCLAQAVVTYLLGQWGVATEKVSERR